MRLNWVAEILLLGVSLQASNGIDTGTWTDFIDGNRINTYWDDVAEAIVVKLEEFTLSYGSNVGIWGDDGSFQDVAANWDRADAMNELFGVPSLTRSSVLASFTALYTHAYTAGRADAICWQIIDGAQVGKTYLCQCLIQTDASFPLKDSGVFRLHPRYSFMEANLETRVVSTHADAVGTWVNLITYVTILSESELDPIIELLGPSQTMIVGGKVYIDVFTIQEDLHPTSAESVITSGPDLGPVVLGQVSGRPPSGIGGGGGGSTSTTIVRSSYKFCDGSTLNRFYMLLNNPAFPYTQLESLPGHPNCATDPTVCNIHFVGVPVVVNASNPVAADGSIQVLAQSSLSDVRYTRAGKAVPYLSKENTTGLFENLASGVYEIFAGDAAGCQVFVTVYVPSTVVNDPEPTNQEATYGVKYRMEHTDLHNEVESRTDILERNYVGDPIEVKGSGQPLLLSVMVLTDSDGNDESLNNKFECLRPTSMQMNLVSERDLQFIGLFSQDDRKYQVKHYKPVGTLQLSGFIVPSVFNEPYTVKAPYYTTIRIADNLQSLTEIDFLDVNGNALEGETPLIEIVALILKKLSLGLNIRVACNIQEDSDVNDEPQAFETTTKEISSFYEEDGTPWKCSRVLEAIIKPFGAKLVQAVGVWNVVRVEEQTAEYDFRLYDKDGVYLSSGSHDPIVEVSDPSLRINSVFGKQDHTLEMVPAKGKVEVIRILHPVTNLIRNGSFDKFDDETIFGWTFDSTVGVTYQAAKVKEAIQVVRSGSIVTEGDATALEISNIDGQQAARVYPVAFPIEYSNADGFSFSFKYRVNLTPSTIDRGDPDPHWVRIGWRLQIGDFFFNETNGWITEPQQWTNYIYVDKFSEEQTKEIQVNFRNVPTVTTEQVQPIFLINGANFFDFDTLTELRAIVTAATPVGKKLRGQAGSSVIVYYTLVASSELDDGGEWIRPDDYHGTTNTVVWHRETLHGWGEGNDERKVTQIYLDDVTYLFYPNKANPPSQEIITIVNNENFKENLTVEIEGGDLPAVALHSKRFIYDNYFKDSSLTPTDAWTRGGVSESTTLQTILAKTLINQYKYPTFKVSGTLIGFTDLNFLSTIKQTSQADAVTISNEEFTGNTTGWGNEAGGASTWAYGSNSARTTTDDGVDPAAGDLDSAVFSTAATLVAGTRILVEIDITRSATLEVRSDWVEIVFLNDSTIVQTAVANQFDFDGTFVRAIKLSVAQDCNKIGFRIRNLPFPGINNGSAQYDMNYFRVSALDIVRYFTVHTMTNDEVNNEYRVELMQLIPVIPSADPTIDDSGEGNTGTEGGAGGGTTGTGSGTGSSFSGDFNADFGGDFDTILN
jgi:hypothetical protein